MSQLYLSSQRCIWMSRVEQAHTLLPFSVEQPNTSTDCQKVEFCAGMPVRSSAHGAVLEMSNTREPDGSIKGGSGWEDRQGLVPNDSQQSPEEAPGSLARVSESSKKSGELDAAADGLTISSHRRHSLGGAVSASRAPRTPRFFFGRSSSLQEGSEPAASSRASQGRGIFGGWGRKGEYSVLENQVLAASSFASPAAHLKRLLQADRISL